MTKTEAFFEIAEPHMKEFGDYRINQLMEAAKAESAAVMAALRDCLAALDACTTQIEQMQGMFDDEDDAIQDALDAAEEAETKARAVLT